MAQTIKLYTQFNISSNKTVNWSWNYAKPSITESQVRSFMTSLITNGSIFKKVPLTAKKAYLRVTEDTEFDLED